MQKGRLHRWFICRSLPHRTSSGLLEGDDVGTTAIQGSVPASPEFPAPYEAGRIQRDAEVEWGWNADVVLRRDPRFV